MKSTIGRMIYFVVGFVSICAAYGLTLAQTPASDKEATKPSATTEMHQGEPVSFWMKKKLDFSRHILEGIASGDCDKIAQSAQTMRSLGKIEAFMRGRNPGYRGQLQAFDMSLDEIIRQANKDNIEGVTLGFNQLTVSCVQCHKQMRESK
ncbi:hypothetical protein ETAA8_12840 [Anatilimnocola aggregata]|uniref:Cytochrome C n=1 Tax=Anatilimnocola aggregata TaxID=2528021 RepID=A0A517Y7J6_9BACT|nr:hypothetical protein [Anatilimnocola aggregata]QDU26209.1 hypothetical protein ETAA8_12840 [Anatilimnocola aggregata]